MTPGYSLMHLLFPLFPDVLTLLSVTFYQLYETPHYTYNDY